MTALDEPPVLEDVTQHVGFAKFYAAKFQPRHGIDRDDLEQAALVGLIKAAANYDPTKGRFTTYGGWYALKEIQLALADAEELSIPQAQVLADIGNEYGGHPRDPDVVNARFNVLRLERPVSQDTSTGVEMTLGDQIADSYTPVAVEDCEGAACVALDRLTARNPQVGAIVADYVLGRRSMKATAAAFGMSTGKARKLIDTGLAELRKELGVTPDLYEQEQQ